MIRAAAIRAAVLVLLAAASATAQQAPLPITASQSAFRWTGTLSQGGLILGTAPAGTRSVALDGKPIALSPDGRFIAGFDRDTGPQASLTATLADGRTVTQNLTIAPRAWRIERLNTLPKFPAPDPAARRLPPPNRRAMLAR